MKDFLIVGTGLTGSIIARQLTDKGFYCLVIDRRNHIGGNCYTVKQKNINVSVYGGHYFRTNNLKTWNYVNKYTKFHPYYHTVKVNYKDKIYSFPINLLTFHQIWNDVKTPDEARKKIETVRMKISNPSNFEERALSLLGEEIYQIFFYGYTKKQWGLEPKELPDTILKRLPIRFDFNDRYKDKKYQGMPVDGYTKLFEELLKGIDVQLETPYDKKILAEKIIYTGAIDEYYDYIYGKLEYCGIKYSYSNDDIGCPQMNYTDIEIPYMRKFCYGYEYPDNKYKNFITATEYSSRDFEPAYPILTKKNIELYNKYKSIKNNNVIFCGRLGSYSYLDMDQAIERSFEVVRNLI